MSKPNINNWYDSGKKSKFPKGYFKGFSKALKRGEKYNKAGFWNKTLSDRKREL